MTTRKQILSLFRKYRDARGKAESAFERCVHSMHHGGVLMGHADRWEKWGSKAVVLALQIEAALTEEGS